jgi:hypothetical protein
MDDKLRASGYSSIDYDLEELGAIDDSPIDAISDTLRDASSIGIATQAGLQTLSLQSVIDNFAKELNQSAIATSTGLPVRSPSAQYKGFAAEEYFKQTLKINALSKGVPDYELGVYTKGALPDGTTLSGIDMETDISVWTRKRPWNKPSRATDYQSKVHKNPVKYMKLQSDPQYKGVELVGTSGNDVVNDTVSVYFGKKTVSSDAITNQEAEALADSMKAQETPEYQKRTEKHSELNRVNLGRAVAVGAATGAILSTTKEIIDVIKNRADLPENQFVKSPVCQKH